MKDILKNSSDKMSYLSDKGNVSACPYQKRCGGCDYIDLPYAEQLKIKEKTASESLSEFVKVDGIVGMDEAYHYRNKVSSAFRVLSDSTVISGVYEANSHRVVNIDNCLIEDENADKIIVTIRRLIKSFKLKIYDEDRQSGLIRHVLIRVGKNSGQIMVVMVLASPIFPSKNNFIKVLTQNHPEISSIVFNINDRRTSMVLGQRNITVYKKGYITDTLCGLTFRISPNSFYQINVIQTQKLYQKAIEFAQLKKNQIVADAYCGIGTIGLIASRYVAKVIAVELNPDAVADAKLNAKENGISNVSFVAQDAGAFFRKAANDKIKIDTVFMDPPRNGSDEAFLSSLCRIAPEKVVYISCNPATQARDIAFLVKRGYRAEKAMAFDMFPATVHVETVVLLSRGQK